MFAKNIWGKASGFMNCTIRIDHGDYIKKYIFNFPDLRNFYIIIYLTHTTKGANVRLFPICIFILFLIKFRRKILPAMERMSAEKN